MAENLNSKGKIKLLEVSSILNAAIYLVLGSILSLFLTASLSVAQTGWEREVASLVGIARQHSDDGENSNALENYRDALAILRNHENAPSRNTAFVLNEMSTLYRKQRAQTEAYRTANEAVEILKSLGSNGPLMVTSSINLGLAEKDKQAYAAALEKFLLADHMAHSVDQMNNLRLIALREVGFLHQTLGNWTEAREFWTNGSELASRTKDVEAEIRFRLNLAGLDLLLFDATSARRQLSALATVMKMRPDQSGPYLRSLELLQIRLQIQEGVLSDARERLEKFTNFEAQTDEDRLLLASAHYNWAELQFVRGDYIRSNTNNQRAEAYYGQVLPREHHIFSQVDHRRAILLQEVGDFDNAVALYGRVLANLSATLGANHRLTVISRVELARALARSGETERAAADLRSLIDQIPLGRSGLLALSALGLTLFEKGDLDAAKPHLEAAVSRWLTGEFGNNDTPPTLIALAELNFRQGKPTYALELIEKSLSILSDRGGDSIARLSEANRVKSEILLALGRRAEALMISRHNLRSAEAQLVRMGRSSGRLSDYEPRLVRGQLVQLMDLVWENPNRGEVLTFAEKEELFRAAQLVHLNETGRAAFRAHNGVAIANAPILAERTELSDRLRAIEKSFDRATSGKRSADDLQRDLEEAARIDERLKEIETNLVNDAPELLNFLSPKPVPLDAVQRRLEQGEAVWLQSTFENVTYLFFVTKNDVAIERVRLGEVEIAELVAKIRTTLDLKGQTDLPMFDTTSSATLFGSLFGAFISEMSEIQKLFVLPDLAVQEHSMATLVVRRKDGREPRTGDDNRDLIFLGHQVPISILPTVQLLTLDPQRGTRTSDVDSLIGFGAPVLEGTGNLGKRGLSDAFDRLSGLADPKILREVFEPLEESRYELEQMKKFAVNKRSALYFGQEASEKKVKSLDLRQVGTLIFATHALVAGDFDTLHEPALVLSPPDEASSEDDGLLLASEIATMKIGARLVVLSACNTGSTSGRAKAPGLSGLAQAFMLAGSDELLVSHWTISTISSVVITPKVYKLLAQDDELSSAKALQVAMREVVASSDDPFFAHPSIWGAFSIVGSE